MFWFKLYWGWFLFSVGFGLKRRIYRSPDFGKFDARYNIPFGDGLHYLNDAKSVAWLASFFTTCEPYYLSLCQCFKPFG